MQVREQLGRVRFFLPPFGSQTQFVRLGGKRLYPLSHLTAPVYLFSYVNQAGFQLVMLPKMTGLEAMIFLLLPSTRGDYKHAPRVATNYDLSML